MSRAVRRALWLITVLVVALFGFLWLRAGMDVHYLLRVLIHRDSSTSDYHWKRAATVAPAATPSPWREASARPPRRSPRPSPSWRGPNP